MKIRKGFVTNSSSSSFILSFKDEEEYKSFKDECEEFHYEEIYDLINELKLRQENGLFDDEPDENGEYECLIEPIDLETMRTQCLKDLEHFFTIDKVLSYIRERTKHLPDFKDRIALEKEIKESQEFKDFYASLFVKRNFKEELDAFINEKLKDIPKDEYLKEFEKLIQSYEYQILREDLEFNRMYFEGIERLKTDNIIVSGTIWDSDGGMLEWAIRQGILKQEFRKYTRLSYNIG